MASAARFNTLLLLVAASVLVLAEGCGETPDPFSGVAARTATPQGATVDADRSLGAMTTPGAGQQGDGRSLDVQKLGTLRLAQWDSKDIDFLNNLAGYIIVHGYLYKVELVDVTVPTYQAALTSGNVDAVFISSKSSSADWYSENTGAGVIKDVGSVYSEGADNRIVVRASLDRSAPDLAEFFRKFNTGDAMIADFSGSITTGRTGIKANVAALTFLKNHPEIWQQWVPDNVSTNVRAVIAAGKTSLLDRTCIPDGGSGGPGGNNCGT
ncbi:MAG: hypothetical protein FJ319_12570 [SAR202 cluster bacterium]|nr:hypothetical protein [SAR202 cluster bacterium]